MSLSIENMGCGDSKPNITGHESPDETPKDDQKNDSTKKDEEINLLRFKIEVLINMLGLEVCDDMFNIFPC